MDEREESGAIGKAILCAYLKGVIKP